MVSVNIFVQYLLVFVALTGLLTNVICAFS